MKTCKSCDACKKLYEKFYYSYFKNRKYYCELFEKLTEGGGVCESYKPKREMETDLSSERFDRAEEDVKYITENLTDKK